VNDAGPTSSPAPAASQEPPAIRCPACGYDLRARSSDRCPECGLDVAGIEDRPSSIPWVHRRKIGRLRGYLATMFKMHGSMRWAAGEMARPVDARSAKSFRRINALLLCGWIGLVAFAIRATAGDDPLDVFGKLDLFSFQNARGADAAVITDLATPWSAGLAQWPAVALTVLLFCAMWTGLASLWFYPRSLDAARRTRATWLSLYASALLVPIAFVLGAIAVILTAGPDGSERFVERWIGESDSISTATIVRVTLLSLLLAGLLLLIWSWTRLNGLLRAVCEPTVPRVMSLMIGFPLASVLLLAGCMVSVPWVAGYVTIVARVVTR
jgi:hypothetical protein